MTGQRDWTSGKAEILVRGCRECGHRFYLPRARCPRCFSDDVDARAALPTGVVVAVTVLPRPPEDDGASGICLVDLDDGIRVMTQCAPDILPGDRITIDFLSTNGGGDRAPLVPVSRKAP